MTAESASLGSDADDPWRGCNPLDPAFRDDPYPGLRRLREVDPVNLTPIGFWRLTRYADVMRLLYDVPAGTRTTDGVLPGVDESLSGQRQFMLQQDPPAHTRLRRLVSRAADAARGRSPERAHPGRGGRRSLEPVRAHLA